MTAKQISITYGVSLATAKRYKKLKAPVDNRDEMRAWMFDHRSRSGVGKYTPRKSGPLEVVTEILPAANSQP
jgi:hypothetical protein